MFFFKFTNLFVKKGFWIEFESLKLTRSKAHEVVDMKNIHSDPMNFMNFLFYELFYRLSIHSHVHR